MAVTEEKPNDRRADTFPTLQRTSTPQDRHVPQHPRRGLEANQERNEADLSLQPRFEANHSIHCDDGELGPAADLRLASLLHPRLQSDE